jgi:hypothetical protein
MNSAKPIFSSCGIDKKKKFFKIMKGDKILGKHFYLKTSKEKVFPRSAGICNPAELN